MTTIPDTAAMVVRASHVPGPPQRGWTYEDYAKLGDLDGCRSLGVFHGEERLISRLLPDILAPTRRFFPREA